VTYSKFSTCKNCFIAVNRICIAVESVTNLIAPHDQFVKLSMMVRPVHRLKKIGSIHTNCSSVCLFFFFGGGFLFVFIIIHKVVPCVFKLLKHSEN